MKPENHVALARKLINKWHLNEKGIPFFSQAQRQSLIEQFSEALSQVEAEALASKVVGPSDEQIEDLCMSRDGWEDPVFRRGLHVGINWYRDNLTLAPNEQDGRSAPDLVTSAASVAQGFEEWHKKEYGDGMIEHDSDVNEMRKAWQAALSGANAAYEVTQVCECEYTREIDANGEQVVVMCNYHKEMGEYYTKGFIEGQASQVRLPEKKQIPAWQEDDHSFDEGYNAAIDDMRKLNGLENV